MAHANPTRAFVHRESITDVVHNLELLFPNGHEPFTNIVRGRELQEKKMQELTKTNARQSLSNLIALPNIILSLIQTP